MALVAAVVLFVAYLFSRAVESGDKAQGVARVHNKNELSLRISKHRFSWSLNKCKPEKAKREYYDIASAYITLFIETPSLNRDWYAFNKRKSEFKHKASLGRLSGFEKCTPIFAYETSFFERVTTDRHESVQRVSDILGYDIRKVPEEQFWKVASDYEERFWFWTELKAQINHPIVLEYLMFDMSALNQSIDLSHMDIPTIGIFRALREKDSWSAWVWDRVSPFFNDEREEEIAMAFINEDSGKLNSLSDEIGFDVSEAGRRKTLLSFANKEGWFAHKYLNPALSYPWYGFTLFGRNLGYYNKWREVFGAEAIPDSMFGKLTKESDAHITRYNMYRAAKDEEDARLAAIKPPDFLPYKEAK